MTDILNAMRERVLLCDGGMGSAVQGLDLDLETDFKGAENCTEILNVTRADAVKTIHRGFLEAGSDIIQTNSFGGSPITLGEFELSDEAFSINYLAAEIARECVQEFTDKDGRQRYVLGSIGPGTKLPSLGHVDYDSLEEAFAKQAEGLVGGGVDAVLIETCQDPLQVKAAVNGARRGFRTAGREVPVCVQVTVETTGTMLVGTDIAAAGTILHSLGVDTAGLNCATGPQEMAEHLSWLCEHWPKEITIQPNAGLPELKDGQTVYPLTPRELSDWLRRFVAEDGVNMIGGCCGTEAPHIQALDEMLRAVAQEQGVDGIRPKPVQRQPEWEPGLASLYTQVPLRQEKAYLSIGERCNANGSKRFREAQDQEDWDTCIQLGKEQQREGSHALDVCTAFVGRDEVADMTEVVTRMRGQVTPPLVFDSTELNVLDEALKLYGGKGAINSINFEDGEEPPAKRLELAAKYGAAVIALTIDEEGMAKDADRKVEVAHRLREFANARGIADSDLIFDPLTFTICTGNDEDRRLGIDTLDAIERISKELPECQIILGLSNISFGLNPLARGVLNSVFLHEALERGLTGAILHVSKIQPLHKIDEQDVQAALDLIYDRRSEGHDPLHAFIDLFKDREGEAQEATQRSDKVEERLAQRIVDGDRNGLEDDLNIALAEHEPLDIINNFLLDGMKTVGELFGAGKMQLPFVLQAAETMKTAVAYLEPYMERTSGAEKGTIVLATVKGDVHDIGKNLVDIILTNNGYKVVNLGIKQPLTDIMKAVEEHKADAVGMSGLLVKSTVIMRENLEEMTRQGWKVPVILGGAALTRQYVEEDCAEAYTTGNVAYARDAFDGLTLMSKVKDGAFAEAAGGGKSGAAATGGDDGTSGRKNKGRKRKQREQQAANDAFALLDPEELRQRRIKLTGDEPVPEPPFWGPTVLARVPARQVVPYLNERMLYQFQWGYRKQGRKLDEYMSWAKTELRPILRRMLDVCEQQDILVPQAVYGYWKAAGDGNDLVLFEPDGETEVHRFTLPRQPKGDRKCIADYLRGIEDGPGGRDVIGLQIVTMGQRVAEVARQWFHDDRYQDYLYLHGLGVEMAEAMAEYVHKRIRAELGYSAEDAKDMDRLLNQSYRGSRYSFGYPACPNLQDQEPLLELLDARQIGVELSDEWQLHPEQSTSAIVLLNKNAKYFSI
jgi:5-methyltetrahydrofolate--homocysteine methyltransferase